MAFTSNLKRLSCEFPLTITRGNRWNGPKSADLPLFRRHRPPGAPEKYVFVDGLCGGGKVLKGLVDAGEQGLEA